MTDEKFLYFYTEYSDLERLLYDAENTRAMTPNVSLTQCRMIPEILINGIIDNGENLKNRILYLQNFYNVDYDVIDAMNQIRQMGNAGVHFQQVYLKEATQSLKFLFRIMNWYGICSGCEIPTKILAQNNFSAYRSAFEKNISLICMGGEKY